MNTRKHAFTVAGLDPDDPGASAEDVSLQNIAMNDAFRARMLRAMALGKESVREGVKKAANA